MPKFFIMLINLHRSGANRTCSPLQLLIKSWICWNIVVLSTSLVSWKKKVNNHFFITLSNCNFVSSLVLWQSLALFSTGTEKNQISTHSKYSQVNVYLKNPSKRLKISVKSMVFPILKLFYLPVLKKIWQQELQEHPESVAGCPVFPKQWWDVRRFFEELHQTFQLFHITPESFLKI